MYQRILIFLTSSVDSLRVLGKNVQSKQPFSRLPISQRVEMIACYSCGSAYLSSCHRTASDANLLDNLHTFHYQDYFVIGGIRTCLGVSDDPMFLWISSNSCPLNSLLVRSHQAKIIIVKRLIQGCNNVTRVWVEPRLFNQGCVETSSYAIKSCFKYTKKAPKLSKAVLKFCTTDKVFEFKNVFT